MAPLAPSNTRRWWFEYSDGVNNHELMFRGGTDTTTGDMISLFSDFMTAIDSALYLTTVLGGRFADVGENISNPFTYDGPPDFGTGEMPVVRAPLEISFEGRSTDGRKVSYSVYGMLGTPSSTYRYLNGEYPALDAGLAELAGASASGTLKTISGLRPIFKTYINLNYNSYWERRARG